MTWTKIGCCLISAVLICLLARLANEKLKLQHPSRLTIHQSAPFTINNRLRSLLATGIQVDSIQHRSHPEDLENSGKHIPPRGDPRGGSPNLWSVTSVYRKKKAFGATFIAQGAQLGVRKKENVSWSYSRMVHWEKTRVTKKSKWFPVT